MAMNPLPFYGGTIDLTDANDPRSRIVNLVAPHSYVLEIGCGSGTIIRYLAEAKQCRTLALEPDKTMAEVARSHGVEVVEGSIEELETQQLLRTKGPFDAIIFADVLEHLRDPWAALQCVRPWLAADGVVLASIPNVAHWSLRIQLLLGRWDYTNGYLMDRTHLRWFTKQTVMELFSSTGYQITERQIRWAPLPGDRLWKRIVPGRRHLYEALARWWPGAFGYQFVIQAKPCADRT